MEVAPVHGCGPPRRGPPPPQRHPADVLPGKRAGGTWMGHWPAMSWVEETPGWWHFGGGFFPGWKWPWPRPATSGHQRWLGNPFFLTVIGKWSWSPPRSPQRGLPPMGWSTASDPRPCRKENRGPSEAQGWSASIPCCKQWMFHLPEGSIKVSQWDDSWSEIITSCYHVLPKPWDALQNTWQKHCCFHHVPSSRQPLPFFGANFPSTSPDPPAMPAMTPGSHSCLHFWQGRWRSPETKDLPSGCVQNRHIDMSFIVSLFITLNLLVVHCFPDLLWQGIFHFIANIC